jgi:hypothetical protein
VDDAGAADVPGGEDESGEHATSNAGEKSETRDAMTTPPFNEKRMEFPDTAQAPRR